MDFALILGFRYFNGFWWWWWWWWLGGDGWRVWGGWWDLCFGGGALAGFVR